MIYIVKLIGWKINESNNNIKSNNIDNIPEIGKLIIKEGIKNNELFIQLSAG